MSHPFYLNIIAFLLLFIALAVISFYCATEVVSTNELFSTLIQVLILITYTISTYILYVELRSNREYQKRMLTPSLHFEYQIYLENTNLVIDSERSYIFGFIQNIGTNVAKNINLYLTISEEETSDEEELLESIAEAGLNCGWGSNHSLLFNQMNILRTGVLNPGEKRYVFFISLKDLRSLMNTKGYDKHVTFYAQAHYQDVFDNLYDMPKNMRNYYLLKNGAVSPFNLIQVYDIPEELKSVLKH